MLIPLAMHFLDALIYNKLAGMMERGIIPVCPAPGFEDASEPSSTVPGLEIDEPDDYDAFEDVDSGMSPISVL